MNLKRLNCEALIFILFTLSIAGCARLQSKPGAYAVSVQSIDTAEGELHATYVRQVHPLHPGYLVVFATGDAGWLGASGAVFKHLAEQGYVIAGFSAPEALEPIKRSGGRVSPARAALALKELYGRAKHDLSLTDSTPIIVVGFSRGATAVAFTALHPELRDGTAGAVAIALTREADYLRAPEGERSPEMQVDDQGRIQIYPALKLLDTTRLAVIQSTNDPYVPAAESRRLLGPDTPTLRLYAVEARNHGFSDARDKLMQDLDDALRWIEDGKPAKQASRGNAIPIARSASSSSSRVGRARLRAYAYETL